MGIMPFCSYEQTTNTNQWKAVFRQNFQFCDGSCSCYIICFSVIKTLANILSYKAMQVKWS